MNFHSKWSIKMCAYEGAQIVPIVCSHRFFIFIFFFFEIIHLQRADELQYRTQFYVGKLSKQLSNIAIVLLVVVKHNLRWVALIQKQFLRS